MKERTVVWKAVKYPGMEYLTLWEAERGIAAEGVVIAMNDDDAIRLEYRTRCDVAYTVREVHLIAAERGEIYLSSDGRGNWFDGEDNPLPDLAGCIDVDITATPFTNTLPIKRIAWTPGQTETLRMVYFSIPEMTFQPDEQRYTCIDARTFRFEQISTGFTALLMVDEDGLVLDYPGLFERVKGNR